MIFGSQRDFNLLVGINRELLSDVVEQEILYYKMSLEQTQVNIYGEGQEKVFLEKVYNEPKTTEFEEYYKQFGKPK